jgi:hypothetical protein
MRIKKGDPVIFHDNGKYYKGTVVKRDGNRWLIQSGSYQPFSVHKMQVVHEQDFDPEFKNTPKEYKAMNKQDKEKVALELVKVAKDLVGASIRVKKDMNSRGYYEWKYSDGFSHATIREDFVSGKPVYRVGIGFQGHGLSLKKMFPKDDKGFKQADKIVRDLMKRLDKLFSWRTEGLEEWMKSDLASKWDINWSDW